MLRMTAQAIEINERRIKPAAICDEYWTGHAAQWRVSGREDDSDTWQFAKSSKKRTYNLFLPLNVHRRRAI